VTAGAAVPAVGAEATGRARLQRGCCGPGGAPSCPGVPLRPGGSRQGRACGAARPGEEGKKRNGP